MSLVIFLDNLILQPLMVIYNQVFTAILAQVTGIGWALIAFGVALNLILLPIYFWMEQAGRDRALARAVVDREIERMKAHYKGRELYYYIKTIHRHYGYSPISVVFSSSSLYLQILVFASVYFFISQHDALNGAEFYSIIDLAKPDGLLFGINLLPILMTLANVISTIVYDNRGTTRLKGFGLAAFFLLLLYSSPSGLVLYWTSNNVFSLLRNLIERKLIHHIPLRLTKHLARLAAQD